MTIRKHVHAALSLCVLGCSQGPSWEPPDDWAPSDEADAGGEVAQAREALDDQGLHTEIVMPFDGQSCSRVGEVVHLGASVTSSLPVHVKWTFHSEHPGCVPVLIAELDSLTTHVDTYSSYTWNTSCALDVPDECGFGQGLMGIEVTDEKGASAEHAVPFCLKLPRGVELAQAQ